MNYIIVKGDSVQLLSVSGIFPPRVANADAVFLYKAKKNIKPTDLADMAHDIAVMQESGLDMLDSINTAIASSHSNDVASLLYDVRRNMLAGASITDAFEEQKKWLPQMFLGVLRTGETSGNIAQALFSIEHFYRTVGKIKDNINGQLIEPSMTIVLSIGVALYLIGSVFPNFQSMVTSMSVTQVPGILQLFFTLNNFLPLLIIIAIAFVFLFFKFRERIILSMPIVGKQYSRVMTLLDTYSTAQILSVGVSAGLPIFAIVDFIHNSVQEKIFKQEIEKVYKDVANAKSLSDSFKDKKLPVQLKSIVTVGERSGRLKDMADSLSATVTSSIDAEMVKLERSLFLGMMLISVAIVAPVLFGFYFGYFGILNQVMQVLQ